MSSPSSHPSPSDFPLQSRLSSSVFGVSGSDGSLFPNPFHCLFPCIAFHALLSMHCFPCIAFHALLSMHCFPCIAFFNALLFPSPSRLSASPFVCRFHLLLSRISMSYYVVGSCRFTNWTGGGHVLLHMVEGGYIDLDSALPMPSRLYGKRL